MSGYISIFTNTNNLAANFIRIFTARYKRHSRYGAYTKRGGLRNQVSIEQRPKIVDENKKIGDWDVDTIIGKNHQRAIVSMTDRVSKLTKIENI